MSAVVDSESGFEAGSYGRVDVSAVTEGGQGEPVAVVAHPSRINADPYLELDLAWRTSLADGPAFRVLVTPALAGDLFHYDGTFDASLALRNLYAEAEGVGSERLFFWAGSRMYRGDDVYLLDFWPLDDLNTVGGGARLLAGVDASQGTFAAHVGMNRLTGEDFQFQQIEVTQPGGVGAQSVTTLDRQRLIVSGTASWAFGSDSLVVRPKLHAEVHELPAGQRVVEGDITEDLPADHGVLLGAQLSAFGWAEDSYVHLFYRHATGLAAVGETTIPTDGFALDGTIHAAREDLVALAANQEGGVWGVGAGAYLRGFADADGDSIDVDDGWEWVLAVRPGVYPTDYLALQAEVSHQRLRPSGLNAASDQWDRPAVTELSFLPSVQNGRGTFARPQLHLRYSLVLLNQDAVDWFAASDLRATSRVQHRLGVGVEWWLNSQSYR